MATPRSTWRVASESNETVVNTEPATYTIRIEGHLDDHWAERLGDLTLTRDEDGATTLTVSVADQTQLHGVLARLRDIGAALTELRAAASPAPSSDRR
jgi:hypothetical protein